MILEKYDLQSIKDYISELSDHIVEKTGEDVRIVFILASEKEESITVVSDDETMAIKLMDSALTNMVNNGLKRKVPPELVKAVKEFVNSLHE